jgi:hypothetical protein
MARGSNRSTHLTDSGDADETAFRISEVADDESIRRRGGAHDACASELHGALEGGFDILDADIEKGVTLIVRAPADTATDSHSIF